MYWDKIAQGLPTAVSDKGAVLKQMEGSGQTPLTFLVSSKAIQEAIAEFWGISGWGDVVAKQIMQVSN